MIEGDFLLGSFSPLQSRGSSLGGGAFLFLASFFSSRVFANVTPPKEYLLNFYEEVFVAINDSENLPNYQLLVDQIKSPSAVPLPSICNRSSFFGNEKTLLEANLGNFPFIEMLAFQEERVVGLMMKKVMLKDAEKVRVDVFLQPKVEDLLEYSSVFPAGCSLERAQMFYEALLVASPKEHMEIMDLYLEETLQCAQENKESEAVSDLIENEIIFLAAQFLMTCREISFSSVVDDLFQLSENKSFTVCQRAALMVAFHYFSAEPIVNSPVKTDLAKLIFQKIALYLYVRSEEKSFYDQMHFMALHMLQLRSYVPTSSLVYLAHGAISVEAFSEPILRDEIKIEGILREMKRFLVTSPERGEELLRGILSLPFILPFTDRVALESFCLKVFDLGFANALELSSSSLLLLAYLSWFLGKDSMIH